MIDLAISHEHLTQLVRTFGDQALRGRQVSRRLRQLLPERFREIKSQTAKPRKVASQERAALADDRYRQHLEELVEISYQAHQSRIQFDTHRMLLAARQSLRRVRRA